MTLFQYSKSGYGVYVLVCKFWMHFCASFLEEEFCDCIHTATLYPHTFYMLHLLYSCRLELAIRGEFDIQCIQPMGKISFSLYLGA